MGVHDVQWTDIAQAVAAIAGVIVALLGFLAILYQFRQLDLDLKSNTRGSIYEMAATVKQVFIDHPELMPYFFEDKEISKSDDQYQRVIAVADLYCLYLEQIATQSESISAENRLSWLKYAAGIYRGSFVIRSYLNDKRDWYSKEFWDAVEEPTPTESTVPHKTDGIESTPHSDTTNEHRTNR